MAINKLAFGGLALGCVAAAGLGAYVATRHAAADRTVPAAAAPATPGGATPVSESEGLIGPIVEADVPPVPAPRNEQPAPRVAPRMRPATPERPVSAPAARRAAASAPAPTPAVSAAPELPPQVGPGGSMWDARPVIEPARPEPVEESPPAPELVELVVPAESVLGLQIEHTISSELARIEDRVEARVTRDVRVGDRVAIPAGALVHGSVTAVEPGGKVKERARLVVRFHTVVFADGTRLALRTDPVVREGAAPGGESAAKIGGAAAGGAILGAILGGARGAAIGGAVGAAGGTAAVMAGDRNPAVLPAGTTLTVRILDPVTVTVEQ